MHKRDMLQRREGGRECVMWVLVAEGSVSVSNNNYLLLQFVCTSKKLYFLDITILGMCRGFQHSKLHYSPTVGKPEVANAAQFEIAGWEAGGGAHCLRTKLAHKKVWKMGK